MPIRGPRAGSALGRGFYLLSDTARLVYAAFVIDVLARFIVGWKVASTPNTTFVLDALEQAIVARRPTNGLIHHSGQGMQYLSIRYSNHLANAGVQPSVGHVGSSYDNALAETVIGLFRTELIHPNGPWQDLREVEFATLDWISWFNHRRLLEPIGDIPPAEAEAIFYDTITELAQAA